MTKERTSKMSIWIIVAISLCAIAGLIGGWYFIFREQRVDIPVVLLHSQETDYNEVIETILREGGSHNHPEFIDRFEIDFDLSTIDFSEQSLFVITNHEVKSLSYDKRNQQEWQTGSVQVLDIVAYPKRTGKLYIYSIPTGIVTGEIIGLPSNITFAEEE